MELSAVFALLAALSWTLAGLTGHAPARALGSLHFNRLRMVVASAWLAMMILITGGQFSLSTEFLMPVIASSLIGVVVGDYFLFVTMRRLGPRRTAILFAANAPIAAILGWLFLGQTLSTQVIFAIFLGFIGVILAIIYGKRRDLLHVWEDVLPPLWIGVGAGFMAALGQAVGVFLLQPAMAAGADPLVAALLRAVIAALCFWLIFPFERSKSVPISSLSKRMWMMIALNGFFGLSFGLALLLKALETGKLADVTMLSSVGPVIILPFIWYQTRKMPAPGAWFGAVLVVACTWLLAIADKG